MKKQSFRSIITLSLLLVVSIMSFASFRIFSSFLERRIHSFSKDNIYSALVSLDLLKEQFYCSIEEHDGLIIESLMQRLAQQEHVLNACLYDGQGELKVSIRDESKIQMPFAWEELKASYEEVGFRSYPAAASPFSRAHLRMDNAPSCYGCHAPENEVLGFIVIDMFMDEAEGNIAFIRNWSIFFTLLMVVVIITFILFMHYRFVRRSLRDFNTTIDTINQGELNTRLSIPEFKELGRLGRNFNSMLDTFQNTQKELQEYHKRELRSTYKMATIGEMSARLAHEIRNPVTGIANAAEILVHHTEEEQHKPILEEILRQAQRVNTAITDLLKYSRKSDLSLSMNNINELIDRTVLFLKNQVKNKEIEFQLELQKDLPQFKFDPEQIENMFLNLGLNAIQFSSKEGSITFNTAYNPEENRIYIYIVDTGSGIPKENLSRVFHPFFTTRNEGTGLGLAIVKEIIDKHEGEIWAENNSMGGSTFVISLPAKI